MSNIASIYDIDLYQPNWSAKSLILTGDSADTEHYKTSAIVENIGYVYISLRGATASKWVRINGEPLGVAWTAGGYERPFSCWCL